VLSTLSLRRRAPDRTGATLRRLVRPFGGLKSATSDVPCHPLVQSERAKGPRKRTPFDSDRARRPRIASTPPPSRGEASTLRSVFHQQVLPNPMLAQDAQEPATVLGGVAAIESASGDPLRSPLNVRQVPTCVVLRRSSLEDLHCQWPEACAPDGRQIGYAACQLLQSSRFLSTTVDLTVTPHVPPRVAPLRCVELRAASRLSTRRRLSCHRFRGRSAPCGAAGASRRTRRGSFAPTLIGPDTSCHDPVSTSAGEADAECMGQVPTNSPADSARPSAPGLRPPTFREEGQDSRTRGAFHQWAAPKGWLTESTGCPQPVEYPLAAPF
jgi:hypothetical protein